MLHLTPIPRFVGSAEFLFAQPKEALKYILNTCITKKRSLMSTKYCSEHSSETFFCCMQQIKFYRISRLLFPTALKACIDYFPVYAALRMTSMTSQQVGQPIDTSHRENTNKHELPMCKSSRICEHSSRCSKKMKK